MQESMEWQHDTRGRKRKSLKSVSPSDFNMAVLTEQKKVRSSNGRTAVKPPEHFKVIPQLKTHSGQEKSNQKSSLASTENNNDTSGKNGASNNETTDKPVKPVFVECNFQIGNNYVNATQFKTPPMMKILSAKTLQIICRNPSDKKTLIEMLETKKLKYWTFTEPADKAAIFILRGYFKAEPNEVLVSIRNEGLEATKVTLLSEKFDKPLYLVHFDKTKVNFNTLVHQHKSIGHLIISWAKIDKSLKSPTQCHRCQVWGHSARNCGRDFRCIKCISSHAPGKEHCDRKTKDGTAKCVNCNGDHPANSRQCPIFLQYQMKIARRRAPQRNKIVSTPAPWANSNTSRQQYQHDFPPLPQHQKFNPNQYSETKDNGYQQDYVEEHETVSFTQPTSSKSISKSYRANSDNNLVKLRSAFMAIPEIDHTMHLFNELTRELSDCMDHGQRLSIMMRYCTPQPIQNAP